MTVGVHQRSGHRWDEELLTAGRLRADHSDSVVTITLDRPESRNAQLPATWEALAHIGSRLPADTRVVVVTGAGPSFSAGLDRSMFTRSNDSTLGQVAQAPDSVAHNMISAFQDGFTWLGDPAFISIAAVAGHAVGAGFQLALACDLRLIADDAQFTMAEVGLGLVPDLGGTRPLVGAVGAQRALEICATGRRVGADEAVRIGLALAAVPTSELGKALDELVKTILSGPAAAVRAVTRLVTGAQGNTPQEQLAAERGEQLLLLRALG